MSDNIIRRQMVRAAVQRAEANGEEISVATVAKYLPGGSEVIEAFTGEGFDESFALDLDDLESWVPAQSVTMIDSTPDGRPLVTSQSIPTEVEVMAHPDLRETWPPGVVSEPVEQAEHPTDSWDVRPKPPEQAECPMDSWDIRLKPPTQYDLGELRIVLARARDRQTTARRKYAIAVERFQRAAGTKPPTPDELFRENARASNQYLADLKAGRVPMPAERSRIGASVIDQMAAAMRGSGQRGGGGRSYARSAYPASMKNRRVKLPSEL